MPPWAVVLLAALTSASVGLVMLRCIERFVLRLERRAPRVEVPRKVSRVAFAAAFGALAVVPFAPHVFFADVELGALLTLALLAVTTVQEPSRAAWWIPLGCALLVPVAALGTLDLIEASRLQSGWLGLGWLALRNPFGLFALVVYLVAARAVIRREQLVAAFLVSALAAVFFLGGFESPLTALLRKSLGEDPGFLNHVTLADGSTQTRVAIGGLVFQLVAASTLIAKTGLCMFLLMRPRPSMKGVFLERAAAMPAIQLASMALLFLLGANLWEWGRSAG
ncbi:MAG TPA: hypothetical protein VM509_05730 [Planctomycetota bacterium]|nr:hypothetical protein [Planctomycetota bacterium]